jgi:hypothetical protein
MPIRFWFLSFENHWNFSTIPRQSKFEVIQYARSLNFNSEILRDQFLSSDCLTCFDEHPSSSQLPHQVAQPNPPHLGFQQSSSLMPDHSITVHLDKQTMSTLLKMQFNLRTFFTTSMDLKLGQLMPSSA